VAITVALGPTAITDLHKVDPANDDIMLPQPTMKHNNLTTTATAERQPSAFKRAHARYRRRPADPDHVDDLDEMLDFRRLQPREPREREQQNPNNNNNNNNNNNDNSKNDSNAVTWFRYLSIEKQDNDNDGDGSSDQHNPVDRAHSFAYYSGPAFGIHEIPGFWFAPAALSTVVQERLAYAAVSTYCEPPHATNIDLIPPKAHEIVNTTQTTDTKMWELWKQQCYPAEKEKLQQQQQAMQQQSTTSGVKSSKNKKNNKHDNNHSETSISYYRSFRKLSWATMGYHYDWTERSYPETAAPNSNMPVELVHLGQLFANTWWWHQQQQQNSLSLSPRTNIYNHGDTITTTTPSLSSSSSSLSLSLSSDNSSLTYTPSACIVNFYNTKSVMGGHQDDLERALDKPIVSISLGRPAVFLLGGITLDATPVVPIIVRPGDVLILGGVCRLSYHSMARVLPNSISNNTLSATEETVAAIGDDSDTTMDRACHPTAAQQRAVEDYIFPSATVHSNVITESSSTPTAELLLDSVEGERDALNVFLQAHRININVRQVYPDGWKAPGCD